MMFSQVEEIRMATEYRIEFTIQRRTDGGDFEDIGFGSSGAWDTPSECAHMVTSAVQNDEWETEPGMPDPDEVRAALAADR